MITVTGGKKARAWMQAALDMCSGAELATCARELIVTDEQAVAREVEQAFDNEGSNDAQPKWPALIPPYLRAKTKAGGGTKRGIWAGSKNPLRDTFKPGHPENVLAITKRATSARVVYASKRYYAGRYHAGGFINPWSVKGGSPIIEPPRRILPPPMFVAITGTRIMHERFLALYAKRLPT